MKYGGEETWLKQSLQTLQFQTPVQAPVAAAQLLTAKVMKHTHTHTHEQARTRTHTVLFCCGVDLCVGISSGAHVPEACQTASESYRQHSDVVPLGHVASFCSMLGGSAASS